MMRNHHPDVRNCAIRQDRGLSFFLVHCFTTAGSYINLAARVYHLICIAIICTPYYGAVVFKEILFGEPNIELEVYYENKWYSIPRFET